MQIRISRRTNAFSESDGYGVDRSSYPDQTGMPATGSEQQWSRSTKQRVNTGDVKSAGRVRSRQLLRKDIVRWAHLSPAVSKIHPDFRCSVEASRSSVAVAETTSGIEESNKNAQKCSAGGRGCWEVDVEVVFYFGRWWQPRF